MLSSCDSGGGTASFRLETVEVVGPRLHHESALGEVGGAVVGAAQGVADGVGELLLDVGGLVA